MSQILYAAETAAWQLDETISAMTLLMESVAKESYQPDDEFDETKAICFAKRFPSYHAAFNIIARGLYCVREELDDAIKEHFEQVRSEKKNQPSKALSLLMYDPIDGE